MASAFPYTSRRWRLLARESHPAEHASMTVRENRHGASNANSPPINAPGVAPVRVRFVAVVRRRRACRFDLQVRHHERRDRVPGHTLRGACATDENELGGTAADRSRCAAASPIAPAAGDVEALPHPAPTCARASADGADLLGMPGGRRRGVLPPHTLPGFGAGRRCSAHGVRGSTRRFAFTQAAQCVEPCAGARRQDSALRSVPAHPFRRRGGARRPQAGCARLHLRSPDGAWPLRRHVRLCECHETRLRRSGACVLRERECDEPKPAGGPARKRAASSSSHSRKAMNPACLRERSGYTR